VPRVSYIRLLRSNRSFRYLWFAEIISFLGDWFNTIALYSIVNELSGTGRAVAGILVGKTLPVFLVAPIAGPLVDRLDRKVLMIVSDVARALLAVGLIVSHRYESLVGIYVCHVLMVSMAGVFIPARFAAFPQVTRPEELAAANALSGGTWSIMLALGAALGGWVTAAAGTDVSLALDSATFLVSAGFLLALPRLPAPAAEEHHHDRSFTGGIRHLASRRDTLALASLKPSMALAGGALLLIPIFGTSVFPGKSGPLWVGVLFCARGFGALLGSMLLVRIVGDTSAVLKRTILFMFPIGALAYLSLGLATSLEAAAVSFFAAAIASGAIWVMSGTLIQREADHRYLGRILSVEFGVMTLVVSVSSWAAGTVLDLTRLTPGHVAAFSGALLLVPFVGWAIYLSSQRRTAVVLEERHGTAPTLPGAAPEAFEVSSFPDEE
jgi:MFS family permease